MWAAPIGEHSNLNEAVDGLGGHQDHHFISQTVSGTILRSCQDPEVRVKYFDCCDSVAELQSIFCDLSHRFFFQDRAF
jgi:hypothetical protein